MAARLILLLAVGYTVLITVLSLVQLGTIAVGAFKPTDKMMHMGAYFGLTLLWLFYYCCKARTTNYIIFIMISVGVTAFGMLIEVLQGTLTTYREPDWLDMLANTIGVLGAFLIVVLFPDFINRLKHYINSFL